MEDRVLSGLVGHGSHGSTEKSYPYLHRRWSTGESVSISLNSLDPSLTLGISLSRSLLLSLSIPQVSPSSVNLSLISRSHSLWSLPLKAFVTNSSKFQQILTKNITFVILATQFSKALNNKLPKYSLLQNKYHFLLPFQPTNQRLNQKKKKSNQRPF
jgi:hypothetical protein